MIIEQALIEQGRQEAEEAVGHLGSAGYLCPCSRDGFECDHCHLKRLEKEITDARNVANWLHARLYEVARQGRQGRQWGPDGSDIPNRDWLSFDLEPELCP